MKPDNTIIDHLLNVIAMTPGARIEEVAELAPELTFREVLYTLCYLSQRGRLRLIVDGQGGFRVATTARLYN
jgi:hypothetical protein